MQEGHLCRGGGLLSRPRSIYQILLFQHRNWPISPRRYGEPQYRLRRVRVEEVPEMQIEMVYVGEHVARRAIEALKK